MKSLFWRAVLYTLASAALGVAWYFGIMYTTVFVGRSESAEDTPWLISLVAASVGTAWLTLPLLRQRGGCLIAGALQLPLAMLFTSIGIAVHSSLTSDGMFWSGLGTLLMFSPVFIFMAPWVLLYAMAYAWLTMFLAQRLFPVRRGGV